MASGYPGPPEEGLQCPHCGSGHISPGVVAGRALFCLDCGKAFEEKDPFAAS